MGRAMTPAIPTESSAARTRIPEIGFCCEKHRLRGEFLRAIHDYNDILNQQLEAVIDGDPDFTRFDDLLHIAQHRKELAKYAWITHVEAHSCEEG